MCRPILVSAALLQALFAWNEFVFALVFISNGDLKTLPVGLMDMQSRLLTDWPVQFAGLTMAATPDDRAVPHRPAAVPPGADRRHRQVADG